MGCSTCYQWFLTNYCIAGNLGSNNVICTNYTCSENGAFLDLCLRYSCSVNFPCFLIDL